MTSLNGGIIIKEALIRARFSGAMCRDVKKIPDALKGGRDCSLLIDGKEDDLTVWQNFLGGKEWGKV